MFNKVITYIQTYIKNTYLDEYKIYKLFFIIITATIFGINIGLLGTGLPFILDFLIAFSLALLAIIILIMILQVSIFLIRKIPKINLVFIIILFTTLCTFFENLLIDLPQWTSYLCAMIFSVIEIGFIYGLYNLIKKKRKNIIVLSILIVTISVNILSLMILLSSGYDKNLTNQYLSLNTTSTYNSDSFKKSLSTGTYTVKNLKYGFYKDFDIKSSTVDLSQYLYDYDGIKGNLRTLYWGFDDNSMPISGSVSFPKEKGKFPLVLIVHGNHNMIEPSHDGYSYLTEHLASKGYVAASVDENFLNFYINSNLSGENDARGILLLNHIKEFEKFNKDSNNPLYNKIDMENIALVGHSRGGEAANIAALFNRLDHYPDNGSISFNFNYNIKSIVNISPTYNQYKPSDKPIELEDVNFFTMHGSYDQDVTNFSGKEQYDNVKFSGNGEFFKSYLYVYGANHGQFNSNWGRYDLGYPMRYFLNTKPIMDEKMQKKILKGYLTGFLECTLKNKNDFKDMFINYQTVYSDLPKTVYINGYEDNNFNVIANYEEDINLDTSSLNNGKITTDRLTSWREERISQRDGDLTNNSVCRLKWSRNSTGNYILELPNEVNFLKEINSNSYIHFSCSRMDDYDVLDNKFNDIDFTIEIEDINNNKASVSLKDYYTLYPPLKSDLYKSNYFVNDNTIEHHLQSFIFPIQAFEDKNSNLNVTALKNIKFIFNKGMKGDIVIDNIGIQAQN